LWEISMDEKCNICSSVIRKDERRFYVVVSDREQYRESWEVIGILCARCFLWNRMGVEDGGR
jgi:hypothetical protein